MTNVHTVARAVELRGETYGCTMVRCSWNPGRPTFTPDGIRPRNGYYDLTMTVSGPEVWSTRVYPLTGRAWVRKHRDGCPVPYEVSECTPLHEMRPGHRSPRAYMEYLVQTYAAGRDIFRDS